MSSVETLRALLAEASESAPAGPGLLATVTVRSRRRRRRRQILVAAAVAAAGLVGFGAIKTITSGSHSTAIPVGTPSSTPAITPSATGGCSTGSAPISTVLVPESMIMVAVYNGSGVPGLNVDVSARLGQRGFQVTPVPSIAAKPHTDAIAEIDYGPKSVGAAQVVRAYFLMTAPGTDSNMHFHATDTSAVVSVTVGGGFHRLGNPTEVHQALSALGRPTVPSGPCTIDRTPDTSALLPLVRYTPPTFPYTPEWTPGQSVVTYDEAGVKGYGTTGEMLRFSPDSGTSITVIFVSQQKPHIAGRTGPASIQGRFGYVVTNALVPLYKNDGSRGTIVYWQANSGDWVTLAMGPSGNKASALYAANHLAQHPLSVLSTFVPARIPEGLHVAAVDQTKLVLTSDGQDGRSLTISLIPGEGGPMYTSTTYTIGDPVFFFPATNAVAPDYVELDAGSGANWINLSSFAEQIAVRD